MATLEKPTQFWIYASAPFAAYRPLQAGAYRSTLPTIPHSAALGLVLNLAAIELRAPEQNATTQVRRDAPCLKLAVGSVEDPVTQTIGSLFQQLHSYPVGNSGEDLKPGCHGAKYWIAPGRRELIVDLKLIIGVQSTPELYERVVSGLAGGFNASRYGLPFAGDNDFMFDRIEVVDEPMAAYWYTPLQDDAAMTRGICRLTVGIDRRDSSRTTTTLCAPVHGSLPGKSAWIWTPREPDV